MTNANDAAQQELLTIATFNDAGQHFTQTSDHWEELEASGLIDIYRPCHDITGIQFGQESWTLTISSKGKELVSQLID